MAPRSKIGRLTDVITVAAKSLGLVAERPKTKTEIKAARKLAAREETAGRRSGKRQPPD